MTVTDKVQHKLIMLQALYCHKRTLQCFKKAAVRSAASVRLRTVVKVDVRHGNGSCQNEFLS